MREREMEGERERERGVCTKVSATEVSATVVSGLKAAWGMRRRGAENDAPKEHTTTELAWSEMEISSTLTPSSSLTMLSL